MLAIIRKQSVQCLSLFLENANKIYTLLLSIIKPCQLIPEKYFSNLINSHCFQDSFLEPSSSFNHKSTKIGVSVHTVAPSSLSITQKIIQVPSLLFRDSPVSRRLSSALGRLHRHLVCPQDPIWSVPWPPFHLLSPSPRYSTILTNLKGRQTLALTPAFVLCSLP